MAILGILTCEILELEFAHLLNTDEDISRITVLENSRSVRMLEALESTGSVNPNRIFALESFAPDPKSSLEVLVNVLELGLHNRKKLLQEGLVPLDEDHPVDDCVGLIIGGRRAYYEEQCKVAGTFFMIPGWTRHWQRIFDKEFGNLSLDMARRLFKNYERSLLISTPIMSNETMQQNSNKFNTLFGLREEIRQGTLDILIDSWNSAKTFLKD
jgi:hypothetical protein